MKQELEIYFHIPFCVRKCNYCDFLSSPANREVQEAYMGALFDELVGRAGEYREYRVTSIFIGGGTPSVVEAKWIERLLTGVRQHYCLSENPEITIEVNPGTVDEYKLKTYVNAGVNRLSIGLQSANAEELKKLGRIHTFEEFQETYRLAREVGITNINVDVMSALPGQSVETYRETLYHLLELSPIPEHISAYSLIVEEGTVFAKWEQEGRLPVPDEDCERLMYEETKRILGEAGFERYEISNYAREDCECRHNVGYWKRTPYVGFGIGAASLIDNQRFSNEKDLQKYIAKPLECRSVPVGLQRKEQMEEFIFLGLRMTRGISVTEFEAQFGQELQQVYGSVIAKNIRDELLYYRQDKKTQDTCLALTEKGLDVSNYVMAQFLFDED